MTQYEKENCLFKINGYYSSPLVSETKKSAFEKAKKELLSHIQRELSNIDSITCEQFFKYKGISND